MAARSVRYQERLTAPWWTIPLAVFWAATLAIAFGHGVSPLVGVVAGAVALGLAIAGLRQVSTRIVVDGRGLSIGAAHLPHSCIGVVRELDSDIAARVRGPDADPRAFAALRGWVATAVTVQVEDPRDPTPYWYVSTRDPHGLASALRDVPEVTGSPHE